MGVTMGLFEIVNLFFCSNMEYFDPKVQDFAEKIGQKGQKPTPEVADGDHGGLGRVQKVQNGLEDGYFFLNAPYCRIFDFFSIISLCRDNWLSFLEKSLKFKAFLDPIESR